MQVQGAGMFSFQWGFISWPTDGHLLAASSYGLSSWQVWRESFGASISSYKDISVIGQFPLMISIQFSRSVMSDSLQPHGLQHTRPPCPSPTPRHYPNSPPSSWRCHPTISSSVAPFSSFPQSFPASRSFPMSQSLHQAVKVLEFQLGDLMFISIFAPWI